MKRANSAGVLPAAMAASALNFSVEAGLLHRRGAGRGQLVHRRLRRVRGASTPYHCVISKPGKPCSATVGTSGSCAGRCVVPVAMQRSLPVLMNCITAARHAGGVEPTGQQVGQLRAGAAVGHVQDEGVADHLRVFHRQMPGAAVAGRAVVQLAGVLLRVGDELRAGRLHRQVGPHQGGWHLGEQRDRLEILHRVVGAACRRCRGSPPACRCGRG